MRQQHDGSHIQQSDALHWLLLLCRSLAATCEVFLHKRHGRRWPGIEGFIGAIAILFFSVFWPNEELSPLLWFMGAYVAAWFVARLGIVGRAFNGRIIVHSRYTGTPRIMRLLPFISETMIKHLVEPILVFLIGVALLPVATPLGAYLIVAAWGLFISTNAAEAVTRSRVQDLHDSVAEQREISERFRESNGNDW